MLPGSRLAPAARFRIWQFVEPLKRLGHKVEVRVISPDRYWQPGPNKGVALKTVGYFAGIGRVASALWITRDVEQFDVVFMNRDIVPELRIDFLEPWLAKRNPRLIFDFDDAIFLGLRKKKMRKILPCFSAITAGNTFLADFAKQCNDRVNIWQTVVDTERFRPALERRPGPVRIGWSGSQSTMLYCLPLLKEVIEELAKTEHFEFLIVADVQPNFSWQGVKMRFIPWSPETEVESLQQFDIGLMPLKDEPFERGKCGAKAISYMAVGTSALVSPVGVNSEIVIHGKTGFHCCKHDEWLTALRLLIKNNNLLREMGKNSIMHVNLNYSVRVLLPRMIDLFEKVARGSR